MTQAPLTSARGQIDQVLAAHQAVCAGRLGNAFDAIERLKALDGSADVPGFLDQLLPWLNAQIPKKPGKVIGIGDIAHVSLTATEMAALPGEARWDAWYCIAIKQYQGITIWESSYPLPALRSCADLRHRIAWKLTENTVLLFK